MNIKSFGIFEVDYSIKVKCLRYNINNYSINKDGTIDVNGDVDLEKRNLIKIPFKFSRVEGDFYCNDNRLISLEGAPRHLGGSICLSNNRLTSLKHFPENIFGHLILLQDNPVTEIFYLNPCREFAELLNEYDVIRDGNKVVEARLRQALEDSINDRYFPNISYIPKEFKFKNYQVI